MTALANLLIRRIHATGPITLADYMAECLLHPQHGYYSTRDPFGAGGDFTTAPEISQMFGELLGLCLAQTWLDQGAPTRFTLAELGPGRGTLMADVLRATKRVPGFHAAAQVVMVEASPTLRNVQAQTLSRHWGHGTRWIQAAGELPEQPLFLLANEFFDALPIHQFQRDGAEWRQRMVGLRDGQLAFGLSDPVNPMMVGTKFQNDPSGTIVEICPLGRCIAGNIGHRLYHFGGAALIIDYGGWRSKGDTLQALRAHRFEDPLAKPGEADLTAHVDFEGIADNIRTPHSGLTDQGTLLQRLGIASRRAQLAANFTGPALESHLAAYHRLTDPAEMGSLFKAIAFHSLGTSAPPGFDPYHA